MMRSPNFSSRNGMAPTMIVLHYTGMEDYEAARRRLCDPAAKVSSHYLLGREGQLEPLVSEDDCAWHAGLACWGGEVKINAASIGIELAHPGHVLAPLVYPDIQIQVLLTLLAEIQDRWQISPARVLGHSDVAPCRKRDPGEWFPWQRLAGAGVALWQPSPQGTDGGLDVGRLQKALRAIGYDVSGSGWLDPLTRAGGRAFARRFSPLALEKPWGANFFEHVELMATQFSAAAKAQV